MPPKWMVPFDWSRERLAPIGDEASDMLRSLQREVDRLYDQVTRSLPFPALTAEAAPMIMAPRIDISESAEELTLTAELPGMEDGDIEVTLTETVLTIRGEKKAERAEQKRDYRLKERSYGTFRRSIQMPFEADPDSIRASFAKGVLTVSIPKPPEAKRMVRTIEVKPAA